eukprot:5585469-Pyramimonas_sp.AAC.1
MLSTRAKEVAAHVVEGYLLYTVRGWRGRGLPTEYRQGCYVGGVAYLVAPDHLHLDDHGLAEHGGVPARVERRRPVGQEAGEGGRVLRQRVIGRADEAF